MSARAVIIGSGPAGLFCAQTLSRAGFGGEIVVLEAGHALEERFVPGSEWSFDPRSVLEGEGGAGFLADCKLCLSPTAGTQFSSDVLDDYGRALTDVDISIWQGLLDIGYEIRRANPNPLQIRAAHSALARSGLTCETYPVRPLGSDMAARFLRSLTDELTRDGVDFRYDHRAQTVRQSKDRFIVVASHNGDVVEEVATHLFLAVGWAGSSRLQDLMPGIATEANDLDIGMRIEFPHFGGSQLREAGDNPKIKFSDGTSYAKTHCLVHRGRVFYYYLNEHCLVDAHAVRDLPTKASSVNTLYRVPASQVRDPLIVFEAISRISREFGEGLPLSQSLEGLMGRRLKSVDASFTPTLPPPESREVDLTYVFPERIVSALRELVSRLSDFAPSILSSEAMVYAPAVQWVMPRLKLDRHFAVPGTTRAWCIGDATGTTAGVLPAAVSGIVAARDAMAQMKSRGIQDPMWGEL